MAWSSSRGIPNNWFNKRRGIATAIVWSAMFPGSLIVGQIIPICTASGQWQTAPFVLAAIAFVVLVLGSFAMRWRPQDVGLLPDGMSEEEAAKQAESAGMAKLVGLTRGEALKTTTFWFIAIAFALIGIGEQGPFQNFPTYIVGNGFDLGVAGMFMTVISLSGVVGKLASGVIIDAVGPRIAYCILNTLAAIGLIIIIFVGDNIVLLFASSILFGIALSSSAVCFSSATAMYLGPKHFGAIYGFVFLGKPIMDAIGVPLVSAIAGTSIGFSGAFGICAAFVIASTVSMFLVRKNKKLIAMEEEAAKEMQAEIAEA
ncbi:MAG: MFS transporter [Coriobacteriales bacterium]